jgi:hypothetical protein
MVHTITGSKQLQIQAKDFAKFQAIANKCKASVVPVSMHPPAKCLLLMLNEDMLHELLNGLPSESILNFCSAFKQAHVWMTRFHILLFCELRCFFLQRPLMDCILGIEVHFEKVTWTLSSDFNWLLEYAFNAFCQGKHLPTAIWILLSTGFQLSSF